MRKLPILLFLLVLAGCQSGPPTVLLVIDAESPEELGEVDVWITMSRSSSGAVCEPLVLLATPEELPLYVAVEQGAEYTHAMAYRVVTTARSCDGWESWPDEGTREVAVSLDTCLDSELTVFDDQTQWDEGISCDSTRNHVE